MIDKGLVLEGGGMRCVYTAGVLETFLKNSVEFSYVIGVSAGAVIGTSFVSKQSGRNKRVTIDYIGDKRYMGFKNLLFKGSFFGFDFLFDKLPNQLVPFNYDAFFRSPVNYVLGVSDCASGKTRYFKKSDIKDEKHLMDLLIASSSIPFISKVCSIDGYDYLDGGVSDAVPVSKAIKDGYNKNVIVLTRNRSYRKKKMLFGKYIDLKYGKYPEFANLLKERHNLYNKKLEFIEKLEKEKRAVVIRPEINLKVSRLEKNKARLIDLYNLGMRDGENALNKLI